MPLRWKTLTYDSIACPGREHMSVLLRFDVPSMDTDGCGLEYHLPIVRNVKDAKDLWAELAKTMTALEAYIGRNSD